MIGPHHETFSRIKRILVEKQYYKVLDVGIGMGFWGFIIRRYCDIYGGALSAEEFVVQLDGVEACPKMVEWWPWIPHVYSNVILGDCHEMLDELVQKKYELVLMMDVLEHMSKEKAKEVVYKFAASGADLLIGIPHGPKRLFQGDRRNDYNNHRETWTKDDVREMMNAYKAEWLIDGDKQSVVKVVDLE